MQLKFYDLLGRWWFPHQQDWQQRRNVKIMLFTLAFTLALGMGLAEAIRMMYYHQY
jgi:hypothetical protein